jgi:hypothetical protein
MSTETENAANTRAAENAHGWSQERAKSQRLQFALDEANTRIAKLEQRERDLQTAARMWEENYGNLLLSTNGGIYDR